MDAGPLVLAADALGAGAAVVDAAAWRRGCFGAREACGGDVFEVDYVRQGPSRFP